ncbi:MAG: hypothetical protein LW832_00735 [Parachlamydia sp.]|jgi:hypothetical protein|nr:hypothetical protein [Parachlamydia sp.]
MQLFSTLSLYELSSIDPASLLLMFENEKKLKIEQVKKQYGDYFCSIVKHIFRLQEVEAEKLNLVNEGKYPSHRVSPAMLGNESAVRGMMGSNRPFLAIKIEVLDATTKLVQKVTTEVIFKRYPLGSWPDREDVYVTVLGNQTFDVNGNKLEGYHHSFLYAGGGMSDEQLRAVQDLLEGKEIVPPLSQDQDILLRMKV